MDEIKELKQDISSIKDDVKHILSHIENDDKTGRKGVVTRLSSLEMDYTYFKTNYEKERAVKKREVAIWTTIGVATISFIKWLFGFVIAKVI